MLIGGGWSTVGKVLPADQPPTYPETFTGGSETKPAMLVLGDAHADVDTRRTALLEVYEAVEPSVTIQTGDLLYYDLPSPTWFIAGNNEDYDVIDALRAGESPPGTANVTLVDSDVVELEGLRVGGLSGNFAPTRFEKRRSDLVGDRRRHFVKAEVDRAKALEAVDVFLSHEAPHGLLKANGYDPGCVHIDDILRAVEPDLCLVGHHHEHAEGSFGPTRVVALEPVWEAYYDLDPETLELVRHPR